MALTNLPDFLTIAQTAEELRCHPDTVVALVRRGELRAIRLGRAIRIVSESIKALSNPDTHGGTASEETADAEHN